MFPHEEYGLGISNHETGYLLDDLNTAEIDAVSHSSEPIALKALQSKYWLTDASH